MTFDHLQAVCWCITYFFLIVYAIKFKTHGIPLLCVCLNFSWETLALGASVLNGHFSTALLIHIPWFLLDFIMVSLYLFYETPIRDRIPEKICFVCGYLGLTVLLLLLFLNGYMLISSFIIDLIMALGFLRFISFSSMDKSWILYFVGMFKLLGDVFAWLFYRSYSGIDAIGKCVLLCNILYIIVLTIKETEAPPFSLKKQH